MKLTTEIAKRTAHLIDDALTKFGPPPAGKSIKEANNDGNLIRFGRRHEGAYYVRAEWYTMERYDSDDGSLTGFELQHVPGRERRLFEVEAGSVADLKRKIGA